MEKIFYPLNISLTDTSEFVITLRNKNCDMFYIRPKSDIVKEQNNKTTVISTLQGVISEREIIEMIESGIKFYTKCDGSFTEVVVVDGNLKSYKNDTTEDNIRSLPIADFKNSI